MRVKNHVASSDCAGFLQGDAIFFKIGTVFCFSFLFGRKQEGSAWFSHHVAKALIMLHKYVIL